MVAAVSYVVAVVLIWIIGTIIAYKTMNKRKASQIEAPKRDIEQTQREYMRATGSQNELPARASAHADNDDIDFISYEVDTDESFTHETAGAAAKFISYEVDTNEVANNDAWADAPYARAKTTKPASAPAAAAELLLEDAIVLDLVLGPPRAVRALCPQPWRR